MLSVLADSQLWSDPKRIASLRLELAQAERELRQRAEREAVRLAHAEHLAWQEAREACLQLERICAAARSRLEAIRTGSSERFLGEAGLARMALGDLERWSVAYTIISFARRRDKLRYLKSVSERQDGIREALKCGGVYDERGHFIEILR